MSTALNAYFHHALVLPCTVERGSGKRKFRRSEGIKKKEGRKGRGEEGEERRKEMRGIMKKKRTTTRTTRTTTTTTTTKQPHRDRSERPEGLVARPKSLPRKEVHS